MSRYWWRPDMHERMETCVLVAAQASGVSVARMMGRSRDQEAFRARGFCAWLCRHMGASYPDVGLMLQKHHTSVINAHDRFEAALRQGMGWAVLMVERASGEAWAA